jgi:hypothetical protein
MSRTHRYRINSDISSYSRFLRKPKTLNEMRQNIAILHDENIGEFEYSLSGKNRIHKRKRLPTLWDDIHISGNKEDYCNWHRYD